MKRLYLITNGYPYGGEKPFIKPELSHLKQNFRVSVISSLRVKNNDETSEYIDDCFDLPVSRVYVDLEGYWDIFKNVLSVLLCKIFWQEIIEIIKTKRKIFGRTKLSVKFLAISNKIRKQLKDIISEDEEGIIYTFWYGESTLASCLNYAKKRNLKIITRTHGMDLYKERTDVLYQPYKYYMNKVLDGIFFISEAGRDYYLRNFNKNLDEKKCHLSYLGVEKAPCLNKITDSRKFVIVSVSNVIPLKRIELIIKALEILDDKISLEWIHFGDGNSMPFIKNLAQNCLGKKDNITYEFKGRVENDEILKFYAEHQVDCFITTSSTEGLPVSIIEAMSYGIPIIATDVGGIKEAVKDNGILLREAPSNIETAEAIRKIYYMSSTEIKMLREKSYCIWWKKFNIGKNTYIFSEMLGNIQ